MSGANGDGGQRPSPMAYAGLGIELVAPVIVVGGVGWLADREFGTAPWLLVVGATVGMVVGFVGFVRRIRDAGGAR